MQNLVNKAMELRAELHMIPEPSMEEVKTKKYLMDYLRENTDLEVVDRGVWFYAHYSCGKESSPMAIRADYDAVSTLDGPRHLCGHDGHSAALVAAALMTEQLKPERDVYFIFQPGEESGEGARFCHTLIAEKEITEIYGFHNLSGYEKNALVIKNGTFCCASTGLEISFVGRPCHAARPEDGANPSTAIAETILFMNECINEKHEGVFLGTVIGIECGSAKYGVSASEGVLRLTLRGEFKSEFDAFVDAVSKKAYELAEQYGLKCSIQELERFPSTENHPENADIVRAAAKKCGISIVELEEPMRWSEDFGYYLEDTKGSFFGIGNGEDYAGIHTEGYEFPDEIFENVLKIYKELLTLGE